MRSPPEDKWDRDELKRLNAEPWQLEHLNLNPAYPHWGPGEDYMCKVGEHGWGSSQEFASWSAFGPWQLDDLNECVHFYFEVTRASENCAACGCSGYNPATKLIADTFYDHGDFSIDFENWKVLGSIENARKSGGATGRRWCDNITQDEVDALVAHNRLREFKDDKWTRVPRTAAEVNAANRDDALHSDLSHDGINRGILIETRAKRLGVYGTCEKCDGHGYVYTAPAASLGLVVWMLHPRKGASRGVRIKNLTRDDSAKARAWLREAAQRNSERFAKVVAQ